MFRGLSHYEIGEQQQVAIPKVVHIGAGFCKFVFGLLFMCIGIVHLAVQNDVRCEPELLWKRCEVKVPFCGNIFEAQCNCVVLNVKKHNWTVLPKEMNEMTFQRFTEGLKIFGFFILVPSFSPQFLLPYMVFYYYFFYFFVTIGTKKSKNYKSFENRKREKKP